jgi:hypothetical protein
MIELSFRLPRGKAQEKPFVLANAEESVQPGRRASSSAAPSEDERP